MNLHIDEEFQSLLPQLSDAERAELEKQIKKDGVLNPIIVWKGTIVDGHNRFMICKLNGITDFPIREMDFKDREEVIEWILRHQLGRRNLTDFQRTRIALRYEEVIAKKAKERQGKRNDLAQNTTLCSTDHNVNTHKTREEVAQIAGTSGATVQRTKYILEHGTEEQIARAEKGGVEMDGRRNSIRAIVNEIKNEKEIEQKRTCTECGSTLPITEFYLERPGKRRSVCKTCYNSVLRKVKGSEKCKISLSATADEMAARLYNDESEVIFTSEDLLEEVKTNGEEAIRTLHTTFVLHKELLNDADCVSKVNDLIKELIESLKKVAEVGEDEGI